MAMGADRVPLLPGPDCATDQRSIANQQNVPSDGDRAERIHEIFDVVMHDDKFKLSSFLMAIRDNEKRHHDAYIAIQMAARFNKLEILQFLCVQYRCEHHEDYESDSPLHVAVKHGNEGAVRILLAEKNYSFCITKLDGNNRTPMHLAVMEGHEEVMKAFDVVFDQLEFNEQFRIACDGKDVNGYTVLHYAVIYERIKLMWKLAGLTPHPIKDECDDSLSKSNSAIHLAAMSTNPDALSRVLDVFYPRATGRNRNIDNFDSKGVTPLMICAERCNVDGVALLMKHGADPTVADVDDPQNFNVLHRIVMSAREEADDPKRNEKRKMIIKQLKNNSSLSAFENMATAQKAYIPRYVDRYEKGLTAMQLASVLGTADILQEIIDNVLLGVDNEGKVYQLRGILPTLQRYDDFTCVELITNECNRRNEKSTFSEMMQVEPIRTYIERFATYRCAFATLIMVIHIVHMTSFSLFANARSDSSAHNFTANATYACYDRRSAVYWHYSPLFCVYPLVLVVYLVHRYLRFCSYVRAYGNKFFDLERPLLFYYCTFECLSNVMTACFCILALLWSSMHIIAEVIMCLPNGYVTVIVAHYLYVGWFQTLVYLRSFPIFHSIFAPLKVLALVAPRFLFLCCFILIGFALATHACVYLGKQNIYQLEDSAQTLFESFGLLLGIEGAFRNDNKQTKIGDIMDPFVMKYFNFLLASNLIVMLIMLLGLDMAVGNTTYKQALKDHKALWYFECARHLTRFNHMHPKILQLTQFAERHVRLNGIIVDEISVSAERRNSIFSRFLLYVICVVFFMIVLGIFR